MTARKLLHGALWLLLGAVVILNVRSQVLDFREFESANPGAGFWDYLRDLSPTYLLGILIAVGVYALVLWLRRDGDAAREGEDDESKRLFREARGD